MKTHRLTTDVHLAVADFLRAGRAFALAVVLRDAGSTPRKAGTRAIIDAEGSIWGTIGGGLIEAQARRLAVEALRSRQAALLRMEMTAGSTAEPHPVCGGTMHVLIDPDPARHAPAFFAVADALRARQRGTLVTRVTRDEPPLVDVCWHPEAGASPAPQPGEDMLIEHVTPRPRLIIVGGGHVGQALAAQAALLEFDLLVIDDRPEFTEPTLYPEGTTPLCGDIVETLGRMEIDADTFIAIVSRGYQHDAAALAACIHSPAGYIGMMGSRRKVGIVRREFIESGRATPEQFDRVHAPIGLDIGAETVPEIAASIVAELVAVRRELEVQRHHLPRRESAP